MKWVESSVFNNMFKTICNKLCVSETQSSSESVYITCRASHNSKLALSLDTPTNTICYTSH